MSAIVIWHVDHPFNSSVVAIPAFLRPNLPTDVESGAAPISRDTLRGIKEGSWIVRNRISRRRILQAGTAGIVGAALPAAGQSADQAARPKVPADPTKVQGPLATDVGGRSPFERPKRVSLGERRTSSLTPLQDLDGIITPSDLHFERHHGGVPAIDPSSTRC